MGLDVRHLIVHVEQRYTGWLNRYLRHIVVMHSSGYSANEIATSLTLMFQAPPVETRRGVQYIISKFLTPDEDAASFAGRYADYSAFPPDIAKAQRSWDRGRRAARMHTLAGMTYKQIGTDLGVSIERARQLAAKGLEDRKSPVQKYLAGRLLRNDVRFLGARAIAALAAGDWRSSPSEQSPA